MQDAPAQGGGVAEALKTLGQGLSAASTDESVPEEARAAFASALQAFDQGMQILEGGGQPSAPDPSQPVPMEAGVSGASPMSHGRPG